MNHKGRQKRILCANLRSLDLNLWKMMQHGQLSSSKGHNQICIRERSSDTGIKVENVFKERETRDRRPPFKKLPKCSKYYFPLKESESWRNGWFHVWGKKCKRWAWIIWSCQWERKLWKTSRFFKGAYRCDNFRIGNNNLMGWSTSNVLMLWGHNTTTIKYPKRFTFGGI